MQQERSVSPSLGCSTVRWSWWWQWVPYLPSGVVRAQCWLACGILSLQCTTEVAASPSRCPHCPFRCPSLCPSRCPHCPSRCPSLCPLQVPSVCPSRSPHCPSRCPSLCPSRCPSLSLQVPSLPLQVPSLCPFQVPSLCPAPGT